MLSELFKFKSYDVISSFAFYLVCYKLIVNI